MPTNQDSCYVLLNFPLKEFRFIPLTDNKTRRVFVSFVKYLSFHQFIVRPDTNIIGKENFKTPAFPDIKFDYVPLSNKLLEYSL